MPDFQHPHEHLPLPLLVRAPKKNAQVKRRNQQFELNKQNRAGHSQQIGDSVSRRIKSWEEILAARTEAGLPELGPGMPLILRTEPGSDIDFLRSAFHFEVVAELEGGYAIVAAGENDLATLQKKIDAFAAGTSQQVGQLYEIVPDDTNIEERLRRILSPTLLEQWPNLADAQTHVVQVSVSFGGSLVMPQRRAQEANETDGHYQDFEQRLEERSIDYFKKLEDEKWARQDEVETLITEYGGTIRSAFIEEVDSFTFLTSLSGKALRDLVLNYKFLFGVAEQDVAGVNVPDNPGDEEELPEVLPPEHTAARIAVLDSGIQEAHPLIQPALDAQHSICLSPGCTANDVGDSYNHGTRVAGASLYLGGVGTGQAKLENRIINIKVLDNQGMISDGQLGGVYIEEATAHAVGLEPKVRILNHSVADPTSGYSEVHMSQWAAAIDRCSYENDVLFVQAAGNIWRYKENGERSVTHHLEAGKKYPDYLLLPESRISNPAQALQALTVGSVCMDSWTDGIDTTFGQKHEPSAFSATGLGMWRTVKPEVVVPSGDFVCDTGVPPSVKVRREASIRLPRSTASGGPLADADDVGTSFAAPMVSALAGRILNEYPHLSMQHVRALIGLSARWPNWCERADTSEARLDVLRHIGFGIPDFERAISSSDSSVTLLSGELETIGMREAHLYQIPIPETIREEAWERDIRIDVSMSYVALPRATRRQHRGYLSTWLDWVSKRQSESIEEFRNRILDLAQNDEDEGLFADQDLPWTIRERSNWGEVAGVGRNYGTLQRDWCFLKGIDLPENLCFAVIGHKGWDKTGSKRAKYALGVSFECLGGGVDLYSPLHVAIEALQVTLQASRITVPGN
jgi:hypothetical protein